MKCLLPTWQNQGKWAFNMEAGFPQNEHPRRNRQKLHGLSVPGLGNHKTSFPLPSIGDQQSTKSSPD